MKQLLKQIKIIIFFQKVYIQKSMKTAQLKKPNSQGTKSIKLKFQNIKDLQDINNFTIQDITNVDLVFRNIELTLKTGQILTQEILTLNCSLIKKLKKLLDEQKQNKDLDGIDSSKIRFRIVKSAKKCSSQLRRSPQIQQASQNQSFKCSILPASVLSQNRSQIIANQLKQNNSIICDQQKSTIFNTSAIGKVKLKKLNQNNKKIQIGQVTQVRSVSNQEIIKKMKIQLRRLSTNYEEKCKEIQSLDAKIKCIQDQNVCLKNKLLEKQCVQPLLFDIKFSLKCLPQGSYPEFNQIKDQNNKDKFSLNNPPGNSQVQDSHKKRFLQQTNSHLQLMIVSQSKQIQSLHKKISEQQVGAKKSSRWNAY